jgi:hypothetical protein
METPMEVMLAIVALIIAVGSVALTLMSKSEARRATEAADHARQETAQLRASLDAYQTRLAQFEQHTVEAYEPRLRRLEQISTETYESRIRQLEQTVAELRSTVEPPPLVAPRPHFRSNNLDDLRAHLRAAHAAAGEDDEV